MKLKKYTCLLMGVFLFGSVWGQERPILGSSFESDVIIKGGQKRVVRTGGGQYIKEKTALKVTEIDVDSISKELHNQFSSPIPTKLIDYIPSRRTLNTFMIGAGSSNMYDTYLSPLKYTGFSIRLMYEQMRDTYWFDGKFRKQQMIEVEFASGQNVMQNVREYWGKARYQLGGHYQFYKDQGLMLSAGGYWDINAGGLYNERNGNNPATARVYANLNFSVMASYKWKKYGLRWQIDTPFMGMLFSPKYGQSYYEISLGNTVGIVNFASFHNQRALRNFVTLDIPIQSYMLRVGYLGDWYQTKVNSVQTHHYTHSFVIGFPLEGIKQAKPKTTGSYWD